MRGWPRTFVSAALFLIFGVAPALSVPMDCEPTRTLWTPVGIYVDSGLGLRYRAEFREYRCVVGGEEAVEVKVKDNREVFLGLPEGVWLLRYPGSATVLFVREGVGQEGLAFAEALLKAGKVDLLLVHEGVRLAPDAVVRARLVFRLKPGAHAFSLAGEGFPLYRLDTILDELDLGLGTATR